MHSNNSIWEKNKTVDFYFFLIVIDIIFSLLRRMKSFEETPTTIDREFINSFTSGSGTRFEFEPQDLGRVEKHPHAFSDLKVKQQDGENIWVKYGDQSFWKLRYKERERMSYNRAEVIAPEDAWFSCTICWYSASSEQVIFAIFFEMECHFHAKRLPP